MAERKVLTADEFLAKVKELVESGAPWGSCYDIDHDQIQFCEDVNDSSTIFFSPVLSKMPDYIYHPFRRTVDALIPPGSREDGRYW